MKASLLTLLILVAGYQSGHLDRSDLARVADFAPHAIVLRLTRRPRRDAEAVAIDCSEAYAAEERGGGR